MWVGLHQTMIEHVPSVRELITRYQLTDLICSNIGHIFQRKSYFTMESSMFAAVSKIQLIKTARTDCIKRECYQ